MGIVNYELEMDVNPNPGMNLEMDVNPNPGVEFGMAAYVGDEFQAQRAEAWAVGERNGVPVQPGDPTYENSSKWHAQQAAQSASQAESAKEDAAESKANAAQSATNSANSATQAGLSATNAEASKDAAAESAANAAASEANAAESKTNAATSEANAAASASDAASKAAEASASATNAATSSVAAAASASNAATSESNAAASASNAASKATEAAASAAGAEASKDAAATSAANAASSEAEATRQAGLAAQSAASATETLGTVQESAEAVAQSEANASQSATNAAGSEANAAASANRAAQQATAASGSAITASNYATDAMLSASSASSSASTAQAAANSLINAGARANTLQPGSEATAEIVMEEGVKVFVLGIPQGLKGDTGAKGEDGKDFRIVKTFASIAEMEAYTGTDVAVGDWVMISSTVEDPDNAKLYVKRENDWGFITDMSGAQGIQGETGNGIASAVLNSDYTLTLTFTDHSTYSTPPIRGAQGLKGDTGNGIASAVLNGDYTLTLTFTDGTNYTTPVIRGAKGDKGDTGDTGNGIASAVLNSDYTLTLTFTDGTSYTTPVIRGAQGLKGDTGNGISSAVLNQDYTLTINFTDGTHYTTDIPIRGVQGAKGDTGNGIASAVLNSDYTLTLTFTDGTNYTTPVIRGAKGENGSDGHTPVKGTDYWTAEDKAEIIGDVKDDIIDDTAGEGDTDKTWSADKLSDFNRALSEVDDLTKDADVTGDIVTFEDGSEDVPLKLLKIGFDPVQDLHGYDHPWPAGGGKNLLPMSLEDMKTRNTSGVWSGNVYTSNGISFNVLTDDGGNVIGVSTSGTATDRVDFILCAITFVAGTQYRINGSRNGSSNSWAIWVQTHDVNTSEMSTTGDGVFTASNSDAVDNRRVSIAVFANYAPNLVFKPMLRLGSIADDSFEPYSNICPITGRTEVEVIRTGKNLLIPKPRTETSLGVTFTEYEDGSVHAEGTPTGVSQFTLCDPVPITNSFGAIKICGLNEEGRVQWNAYYIYDKDLNTIKTKTINSAKDTTIDISNLPQSKYVNVSIKRRGSEEINETVYPMIIPASESTEWEPYRGHVYSITFPSEAGTVYGGSLTVNRDGTGELVVDEKSVTFNGNESWTNGTTPSVISGIYIARIPYWRTNNNAIVGTGATDYLVRIDGAITNSRNAFRIQTDFNVAVDFVDNLQSWKTYLSNNPLQLCYPLATPITYTLTTEQVRTLLGLNHVWSSDGDIEQLTYYLNKPINTDVQELREQIVAVQNSIVAPVLSDMIADTALVVNDFRIVQNTLYKVTSPIASGGTLTPGTNCIATSIGEQLTALLNA